MRSIIDLPNDYVVVDLETTGLNPRWEDILELAAIRYRNGIEESRYVQLIKPSQPIRPFISRLTGITDEMVAYCPTIDEAIGKFSEFVGDNIMIGHNIASFDSCFINHAYMQYLGRQLSNPCVDTIRLFKKLYPEGRIRNLEWLADHYKIPYENAHRGASDCAITHACYQAMRNEILSTSSADEFIASCEKKKKHQKSRDLKSFAPSSDVDPSGALYQKVIVFTGSMLLTRAEAIQIAVDAGAIVKNKVTTKTTFLVGGVQDPTRVGADGLSSKEEAAIAFNASGKANIQFISEEEFLKLAGKEVAEV